MKEYIERKALIDKIFPIGMIDDGRYAIPAKAVKIAIDNAPAADVVEVDTVAEMLRWMFDDDCACNYNGIDGWLTEKCKYAETDCPMPAERLGCWKEFVKHFLAKMDGERNGK